MTIDPRPTLDARSLLLDALERHDADTRKARVQRNMWHSQFVQHGAVMFDRHESAMLLEEARKCYFGGQFIATVIVAMAYVEQNMADLIEAHGHVAPGKAKPLFSAAKSHRVAPDVLIDRADRLRELRNAMVHRRDDDDEATISRRMAGARRHPKVLLEADAKEALEVMYGFFSVDLAMGGTMDDDQPEGHN